MNAQIKSPYNIPEYVRKIELIPLRHVCGRLVYANLEGDTPVYYAEEDCYGECTSILSCPHCPHPLDMDWIRPLWYVEPMPTGMAITTKSRRVCSNCWGSLTSVYYPAGIWSEDDGMQISAEFVYCPLCKYETRGYVTQSYVGYAREDDYLQYGRAIIGLAEALELDEGMIPVKLNRKNKPVSALLTEMGF